MHCSGKSNRCARASVLACGVALGCVLWVATLGAAPAEAWTKVTSAHFTILTPADEATARSWAVELEQFRRGLQAIIPVPADQLRPVTVVLFKTMREMEPYLPLENGRPARMGGFFARADEINTIMLSLAGEKAEVRHTVFHEAVHWHLSAFEGRMPLWLGEGLAELYATFELSDAKTYSFGKPIESYVALLRREPQMPLARLFGTGRESLLYNEGTRTSIFYAQSWALVHYLFFGEGSPGRGAVTRYLGELRKTASPDEAFTAAFGAGYGVIEQRLQSYVRRGRYRVHRYPRSTDDIARELVAARAAPGDLELAQGSLLLGAGNSDAAEAHLWRAVALAPGDPRGWELLGHLAVGRKDFTVALDVLTKAAHAGSTNYLVYHNLGVAHFPPSAVPGFGFQVPDPVEMDQAAASYRKAIQLAPAQVGSYEGLAGLMHSMQTFAEEDLAVLTRGLALDPENATIETGIAAGEIRAGRAAEGRARLERLLAGKEDSHERGLEFARKVLATETLRSEIDQVERLTKKSRFEEALQLVERALSRELDPPHRQMLEKAQLSLRQFQTISTAVAAANQGEAETARRTLNELLTQKPEPTIRADAERLLREIDRHENRGRERRDGR
jgi:tetratricopeptide (TPR) repeat protein